MKDCVSRSYVTAPPVPKMPPGLVELMEGLTKEVLRNNPSEVYKFCAQHMKKLLELRDGDQSKKCFTLEQKIAKATNTIKQRAEKRRQKYDNDMQMLKQTGKLTQTPEKNSFDTESLSVKETNIEEENAQNSNSKSEDINNATVIEKKVNEDLETSVDEFSDINERKINTDNNTDEDLNNDSISNEQVVPRTNFSGETEIPSTVAIVTDEADKEKPLKETDSIDIIVEIDSSDVHDREKTDERVSQQEDIQNQSNDKHDENHMNDKDLELKIDIIKHEDEENDQLAGIINFNDSGTALESKDPVFLEQYINQNSVPNKEKCTSDESEKNVLQQKTVISDEGDGEQAKEKTFSIDKIEQIETEEQNAGNDENDQKNFKEDDTLKSFDEVTIDKNKSVDDIKCKSEKELKGESVDEEHLNSTENIVKDIINDHHEIETLEKNKLDQENSVLESTQVQEANKETKNEINIDEDKRSVNEGRSGDNNGVTQNLAIEKKELELPRNVDQTADNSSTNECALAIIDTPDLETRTHMDKLDNTNEIKTNNNNDIITDKPLIINIEYERNNRENLTDPNDADKTENVDDAVNTSIENDAIKSEKSESGNSKSTKTMDLETAAITIQKVFRNFLFRTKTASFDDSTNIEFNIFDHESDLKDTTGYANQTQILKTDKRTHGISRMDTVLQTVNEEKSLSLSTDDSSTLSSAATVIQAHIRGFLVRNRLNRNKTISSTSLADSDDPSASFEVDPDPARNKTVLNIHIVPEGGHFLSRDESMLTSVELSLDGSPPASTNLHPLGYDKSERRKQLKREDAIQSVSPPSNNSTRLSEEHDSIKEVLINEAKEILDVELPSESKAIEDNDSDDVLSKGTVEENQTECRDSMLTLDKKDEAITEVSSDELDVVTPFENVEEQSTNNSDHNKLVHSGEFHDVVLPTKVSRNDTSVVRGE